MPDFEALIRHQQLKQPTTNQRLKVVDSPNFEEEKNEETKFTDKKSCQYFTFLFNLLFQKACSVAYSLLTDANYKFSNNLIFNYHLHFDYNFIDS